MFSGECLGRGGDEEEEVEESKIQSDGNKVRGRKGSRSRRKGNRRG